MDDDNDETVELMTVSSSSRSEGVRTRSMAASASDDITADDNNDETTTLTGGSSKSDRITGTSQLHTLALNTSSVSN